MQRPALMRYLGPCGRAPVRLEEGLEPVEVGIHEDAQAKPRAGDIAALPQHQAMVTGFLDAAKIECVALFRGRDQADHLLIELTARREVADGEDDMARVMRNPGSKLVVGRLIR